MVRIVVLSILSFCICLRGDTSAAQPLRHITVGDENGAWLGVSVTDVTADREKDTDSREGALVSEVIDESPAEEAGIREGDVIVRFDGRGVGDSDDLVRAVRRSDPGDEVNIVVRRDGKEKTVTATLEENRRRKSFAFRVPSIPRIAPLPRGRFRVDIRGDHDLAGLTMQDLGRQLGEYFQVPGRRGVLVTSVDRNSAGEKAGVKAGDVIVRVNGNTVRDIDDCLDEVDDAESDDVRLDLIRRGKNVDVTVRIDRSERSSGELFFDDGHERLRDRLRYLGEEFPADRETLNELKEHLREMKEHLKEDIGDDLRESLLDRFRDLGDELRETILEHLPHLRQVARAAFLSI